MKFIKIDKQKQTTFTQLKVNVVCTKNQPNCALL